MVMLWGAVVSLKKFVSFVKICFFYHCVFYFMVLLCLVVLAAVCMNSCYNSSMGAFLEVFIIYAERLEMCFEGPRLLSAQITGGP